jgi:signal transduction histidine kinase
MDTAEHFPPLRTHMSNFSATESKSVGGELPFAELAAMQSAMIDVIASGASLRESLEKISSAIERMAPPALCSILVMSADGKHLRHGAAPSLPAEYTRAVDGVEIGPNAGSCGTACYTQLPVTVTDIAHDPKWAKWRDLALAAGLRACWSKPVIGHDGTALGAIALYYRESRAPAAHDWALLEAASKLVRLALVRQHRAEKLREAEARGRLAVEASGLGVYDVDLVTMRAEWSGEFRTILGLPELTPASLDVLLDCIRPEDRARFAQRVADHSNPFAASRKQEEYRIIRAGDGEERVIIFRGCVLTDENGTPVRTIGTIADATESRRREAELAAAKAEAERANQAKSAFLAGMSHELRTPLNSIIGFSDLIRNCTLGPIAPAKYREYVDDIHDSGQHLLSLINDILDIAKIEAGKHQLTPREVSPLEIAAGAMRFVETQAAKAGVTIETALEHDFNLIADERALTQILVNLLSNAVKFSPSGSASRIFARRLPSGSAIVGVEDNGIGMTEEGLQRALEPFGQAARMDTVEGRGTGLGLPLVRALVKAHGAQFHIESRLGNGTRAWAEFPPKDVVATRAVA